MIMSLFDNKELLYTSIGLLCGILIFLIYIIVLNNKKNSYEKHDIEFLSKPESVEESKVDIEEMLQQMKQEINDKEFDVRRFEDEQEEKSIISYQELLEANKKEKPEIEEQPVEIAKPIEQMEEPIKKFRNSEFISPIYGRQDSKHEYPTIPNFKKEKLKEEIVKKEEVIIDEPSKDDYNAKLREVLNKDSYNNEDEIEIESRSKYRSDSELEKTFNIEQLSEEIKKNDEFLNMLKEFRRNLE